MYRILTEDKRRDVIFSILDYWVDGYTVTPTLGSWKGVRENSLAIDLVDVEAAVARSIAESIRVANEQEAVLILEIAAKAEFLTAQPELATA